MKVLRLLGVAFTALVLVLMVASEAGAVGPTVTLTPDANLHNGQTVLIRGAGFAPGSTVMFTMWNMDGGQSDPLGGVTVSRTGTFVARVKVLTGLGAGPGCGMSPSTLRACYLGVGNAEAGVKVTLNFAVNTTNGFQTETN